MHDDWLFETWSSKEYMEEMPYKHLSHCPSSNCTARFMSSISVGPSLCVSCSSHSPLLTIWPIIFSFTTHDASSNQCCTSKRYYNIWMGDGWWYMFYVKIGKQFSNQETNWKWCVNMAEGEREENGISINYENEQLWIGGLICICHSGLVSELNIDYLVLSNALWDHYVSICIGNCPHSLLCFPIISLHLKYKITTILREYDSIESFYCW